MPTGRRWYLVAWDTARADWRTFRVDRIDAKPAGAGRFTARKPPASDLAAYVARGVSAAREGYQARVLLHAPLALLAARVPPHSGTLEALDEHSTVLHASADRLGGLAIYIAGIGVDFEVLAPAALAEEIARLAERFTRAAKPPISGSALRASRSPPRAPAQRAGSKRP